MTQLENSTRAPEFHSAKVGITFDKQATHRPLMTGASTSTSPVLFRSYRDGAQIGCVFFSNEAIEYIYKKHHQFLKEFSALEHQSGVE